MDTPDRLESVFCNAVPAVTALTAPVAAAPVATPKLDLPGVGGMLFGRYGCPSKGCRCAGLPGGGEPGGMPLGLAGGWCAMSVAIVCRCSATLLSRLHVL